jgi:nitroreductase
MTPGETLVTSPMLFGYRARDGRLAAWDGVDGPRFRLAGGRAAEIVTAFLEARSIASAESDGFSADELREAREAGILVSGEEHESIGLWERNGWSRPAYLMFSQMDVPYLELDGAEEDARALVGRRRAAVGDYRNVEDYPSPRLLADGRHVELPTPPDVTPRLSALTSRRSARGFSKTPPSAEQLAGVLHAATHGLRTIATDRADGDPFHLLNSFYSWAHLFVVEQAVEDHPPGDFEYDPLEPCLLTAAEPPSDAALAACVQGQRWVLGTGFVLFVVADFRGYAWLYRSSRAYLHVLMQVGELGQEVITAATELGLGGWTTPAVHESRSAALLGLPADDAVDVLSMVKLGRPKRRR